MAPVPAAVMWKARMYRAPGCREPAAKSSDSSAHWSPEGMEAAVREHVDRLREVLDHHRDGPRTRGLAESQLDVGQGEVIHVCGDRSAKDVVLDLHRIVVVAISLSACPDRSRWGPFHPCGLGRCVQAW